MEYLISDEAMQIWLEVVGELPAKPSVGMTEENASDPVYGPFIRGLAYAHTTKFADESGQRQLMVEMVERIDAPGDDRGRKASPIAAEAEQKLLDEYYARTEPRSAAPARARSTRTPPASGTWR